MAQRQNARRSGADFLMDRSQPFNAQNQVEPQLPGGEFNPVTEQLVPFTGPLQLPIKVLQNLANTLAQQEEAQKKILEELQKQASARMPVVGFAVNRIIYDPSMGVKIIDISQQNRLTPSGFSLVTFKTGNESANAWGSNIYGGFGRSLIKGDEFAPRNFEFVIPIGGKLAKYAIRQGLEAISIWSETSFDAILYTTAASVDNLPDL